MPLLLGRTNRRVSSSSTGGPGGITKDPEEDTRRTAQQKAADRRAQVRRAQIQHRQRKANYAKELEMQIARLNEDIQKTTGECHILACENVTMTQQLQMAGVRVQLQMTKTISLTISQQEQPQPSATLPVEQPQPPSRVSKDYTVLPAAAPEYSASMVMHEAMGTPAFQIKRQESPSSPSRLGYAIRGYSGSSPGSGDVGGLPQETTDLVINFILALEHICWDHFDHSYYTHSSYNPHGNEHGHALMASHIALQTAPAPIFSRICEVQTELRTDPSSSPSTTDISWSATGLTLESLYGLASTLNPPDAELAPVQAWFEIVKMYGLEKALNRNLLERLQTEFKGVVKCLHFGAVIERDAFDSVVSRVIEGFALEQGQAQQNLLTLDPQPMPTVPSSRPGFGVVG